MKAKDLRITYDSNMQPVVSFNLISRSSIDNLKTLADLGKPLSVEVKVYREKRSKDANAYYWALITQIADIMCKSQEDIHIFMLQHYGVKELIKLPKESSPIIKRCFKFTEVYREIKEGDLDIIYLWCFPSSATYDTKQFSTLLSGAIQEAKDLDIETMSQNEVDTLMKLYGKESHE